MATTSEYLETTRHSRQRLMDETKSAARRNEEPFLLNIVPTIGYSTVFLEADLKISRLTQHAAARQLMDVVVLPFRTTHTMPESTRTSKDLRWIDKTLLDWTFLVSPQRNRDLHSYSIVFKSTVRMMALGLSQQWVARGKDPCTGGGGWAHVPFDAYHLSYPPPPDTLDCVKPRGIPCKLSRREAEDFTQGRSVAAAEPLDNALRTIIVPALWNMAITIAHERVADLKELYDSFHITYDPAPASTLRMDTPHENPQSCKVTVPDGSWGGSWRYGRQFDYLSEALRGLGPGDVERVVNAATSADVCPLHMSCCMTCTTPVYRTWVRDIALLSLDYHAGHGILTMRLGLTTLIYPLAVDSPKQMKPPSEARIVDVIAEYTLHRPTHAVHHAHALHWSEHTTRSLATGFQGKVRGVHDSDIYIATLECAAGQMVTQIKDLPWYVVRKLAHQHRFVAGTRAMLERRAAFPRALSEVVTDYLY